ncbi:MAG: hypothetical protein IJ031_00260 [Oscillospiraceae bacterium]|nr:hypothetical protein [Oscillospiraceae bacterium]
MKSIRIIFCVLFFAICAFPAVSMFFTKQDASLERREKTELPKLMENGEFNTEIGDQLEGYISENFGFRAEMVTANNGILSGVFGVSGEDKVIVGSDEWLFLEETSDDYQGINQLSDREIRNVSKTIRMIEDYVRENGLEFVFTVAPNKNTLYGEFMPYYYVDGENSNLNRLNSQLEEMGVSYIDLMFMLKESYMSTPDDGTFLYHKRDTHWNNKGAFIATNGILRKIGFDTIEKNFSWVEKRDYTGDLEAMIYPKSSYKDIQYYPDDMSVIEGFKFEKNRGNVEAQDFVTNSLVNKDGSILFFRDSFANAIAPFLSTHVGNVRYQKYIPYQVNLIEREKYDAVVIEIAERNIPELLKSAPKIPAKLVTLSGNAISTAEPGFTFKKEKSGKYFTVTGEVDKKLINVNSDIYVLVENSSSTYVFEAFSIKETGFSSMIEENLIEENAKIKVVIKNGDELNILENSK